jgi:hypothetical protein
MYELLGHALFIKMACLLSMHITKQSIQSLGTIDNHIQFWEYQFHHPTYYFFHKSPLKWFSKEQQLREVRENLAYLRAMQDHFFTTIGSFNRQLAAFNPNMPFDKQCQWIGRYSSLSYHFFEGRDLFEGEKVSLESFFSLLLAQMRGTEQSTKRMQKQLVMMAPPAHLVRHWIGYLSGATIVGAALWYFHHNQEKVANALKKAEASMTKTYYDIVRGPLIKIKEALLGSDAMPKENEIKEKVQELRKRIHEVIQQDQKKLDAAEKKDAATIEAELKIEYLKVVSDYHTEYRAAHVSPEMHAEMLKKDPKKKNLIKPADDDKTSAAHFYRVKPDEIKMAAQQLDLELLDILFGAYGVDWKAADVSMQMSNWYKTIKPEGRKISLIDDITPLGLLYARIKNLRMNQMGERATRVADPAVDIVDIVLGKLDTLLTQHRGTFALTALLPAGLVAYGTLWTGKKTVQTVLPQPYDHKPLRAAFYTAARVLNVYDIPACNHDQITDTHLGQLLYSLHILKNEARKLTENDRWEFTEDIKQLASPAMTVPQKLRLISIMQHRFPFLHAGTN